MLRLIAACLCLMTATNACAENLTDQITAAFHAGDLPNLHAARIELGDQVLGEAYFEGTDEAWGEDLGPRDHGPETLHDLRSVTKSIVGLLYGIALSEGKVPPPSAPLYAQFPDYAHLRSPEHDCIRIEDVLTMRMGLHWNEGLDYTDPTNSEIEMERAPDRYAYILSQPVVQEPGQVWAYSGGATALLGKIIEDGTGLDLEAYARARLFKPLGITQLYWQRGQDGVISAASGLRLTLPDLAKVGQLVAREGVWGASQIVPAEWLAQSLTEQTRINEHVRYGYHWYLSGPPGILVAFAAGNGGQRLTVQPSIDFVTASFSGDYNSHESWVVPLRVFTDFAVPAAREAASQR